MVDKPGLCDNARFDPATSAQCDPVKTKNCLQINHEGLFCQNCWLKVQWHVLERVLAV